MFERLVMDAVNAVAFPMYAKQLREGQDVRAPFLRAAALISVLGWSFLACLAILAFPLVRVLYGTQWDAAVDPTRWLAAAMMLALPTYVCLAPMLASGAVAAALRAATLSTLVYALCAGVGASLGLLTLSQLLLPAAAIASGLWLYETRRHIEFGWYEVWITFCKSAAVAAASAMVPLAVSLTLGWRSEALLLTLVVALPGAAACFCAMAYLTRHPIWDEMIRVLTFATRLTPSGGSAAHRLYCCEGSHHRASAAMAHESFERTEEPARSSDRAFGFVFAGVFAVLAALPLLFGGPLRLWCVALSAAFLLAALVYPALLAGMNRAWGRFGRLLHRIVSPIVLGIMFFGVVTPTALLRRALRHDPLRLRTRSRSRELLDRTPAARSRPRIA